MKCILATFTVFLACAGLSAPVSAQETPEYDIKAFCKEVATMGGGGSAVIELQCRKDEQRAKSNVQAAAVPPDTLRICDEIASSMGSGSYAILEQCIKDELDAAAQLQ